MSSNNFEQIPLSLLNTVSYKDVFGNLKIISIFFFNTSKISLSILSSLLWDEKEVLLFKFDGLSLNLVFFINLSSNTKISKNMFFIISTPKSFNDFIFISLNGKSENVK